MLEERPSTAGAIQSSRGPSELTVKPVTASDTTANVLSKAWLPPIIVIHKYNRRKPCPREYTSVGYINKKPIGKILLDVYKEISLKMSSGIIYSAVARTNTILVSSQRCDGDFESVFTSFLPTIPVERNTKTCFPSNIYYYHVLVEDMLIYICVSETDFGRNIPYAFLNEIKRRFTSGSLAIRALTASEHEFDRDFSRVLEEQMFKFSSEPEVDGVGKVRNQVNEVMGVMNDNIRKVVDRGEKLETLIDKTSELEVSSSQFRSTSRKVRRAMWCRNVKMWILCIVVAAVIIVIIALMATNVIPIKH